jgi:hypothetical protein
MQGFADDSSAPEPSGQVNVEKQNSDQMVPNDSSATKPNDQANVEEQNGNPAMPNNSSATEPNGQANVEEQNGNPAMANDSFAAQPSEQMSAEEQNSDSSDEQMTRSSMSMESEDAQWCLSPYHEFHASIRHNEANGIGYKDGYTTLEVFGIYDEWGSSFMPFFDVRGHVFNNGYLAGNVGIGERTLLPSINHTFGSYLYYDVRRVGHGLTVNQLSPGIELVGERMEYRINGYFPLGKQKGHEYGFKFDKFSGNSIILKGKQQQAMMGGDAEVGVHIPQNTTYDVYAAAGPYYFHSSHASAWGGKVRLLGRYKEYVTLEVVYSYDHLFRSVVQGSIAFTLPFGRKLQRCGKCCPQTDNLLLSRAAFAPSRFEIPVVKRVNKREKAIDPATGQPWVVWFVNNTSHSAGTFESPFPTLLQAQNASSPNDMIYVFPGDGTTKGMNAGITLQDGQTFFGSGIKQQFATTKGTKTIPAFTTTAPLITASTGNVVNMVNENTVSGFNILATASGVAPGGISLNLPLTNGAIIQNNNITATGSQFGIVAEGLITGIVDISNNQIIATNPSISADGIFLELTNTRQVTVSENIISGFDIGLNVFSTNVTSYAIQVYGNSVSNFTTIGFFFNSSSNTAATVNAYGNTLNSASANAVGISMLNVLSSSLNNNSLTINGPGIAIVNNTGAGVQYQADVSNNIVNITGGSIGIQLSETGPDSLCASITKNQVTGTGTGLSITTTGSGAINIVDLSGNIAPDPVISGNVNLVAPGTCTP